MARPAGRLLMFRPMKPATIAARAECRKAEREARRADLRARLVEASLRARRMGEQDDIWTEMLAEFDARSSQNGATRD